MIPPKCQHCAARVKQEPHRIHFCSYLGCEIPVSEKAPCEE